MSIVSSDISKAVRILSNGGVIGFPTETVYGLAANIYSEEAIQRIFEIKQRPACNPLIVHVHDPVQLSEIVTDLPDKAQALTSRFWPGPLTLILKKTDAVPAIVSGQRDTVAVRIPRHPIALELLRALEFPLAAPSANPFNRISPTSALHVENYFQDLIPMVLDGGECEKGIESTIVGFEGDEVLVYRLGSISLEQVEQEVGQVSLKNRQDSRPTAPGMFSKHYAPSTPLYLVADMETFAQDHPSARIAALRFSEPLNLKNVCHTEILSSGADLEEAATRLYGALHLLDSLDIDFILAERLPDKGLGRSMNDRLERAAKQSA